ncbi:MAG TPA: hypothetical protein VHY37_08620 [Tepidisphaeraceae bacterium]|nr:hypothetical protein [Tepidisphaeraceae bacterium]
MFKSTTHAVIVSAAVVGLGALAGCEVRAYVPPPPAAEVTIGGPAVEGGVAIENAPPPDQRVYVYDPGYPPGVYLYGGYYYYNGYRYPHDVFVHRYVDVNVRNHRYMDRDENRRQGEAIRAREHVNAPHDGNRPEEHKDDHH